MTRIDQKTILNIDYDIANYSTAEGLRQIAEEFIYERISKLLDQFERKSTKPEANLDHLTEKIPTVNFQQECLLSQLKVDLSWRILDWDWGEKFHIAGYNKDRSDLRERNKVHYVRQTTPFGQK